MYLNKESSINPDETPRKKFLTSKRIGLIFAAVAMSIAALIFWPDSDEPESPSYGQNDILFYDPTPPVTNIVPPPLARPADLICSQHFDACATQANFDSEVARMTAELDDRDLPVGSEDVVVRDAQMSHLITDLCYEPTESTFVAAEKLWADVWVNTPQTNRKMSLGVAATAVCPDAMDRLFYDYVTPKDPYDDPSFGGESMPQDDAPPVFPTETVTPPTTNLAPASDRDYK